jgi:hypothetical protein
VERAAFGTRLLKHSQQATARQEGLEAAKSDCCLFDIDFNTTSRLSLNRLSSMADVVQQWPSSQAG